MVWGLLPLLVFFVSCNGIKPLIEQAEKINYYEEKSRILAKENRLLSAKIADLEYQLKAMEAKNSFLKLKMAPSENRSPASIKSVDALSGDLVKQHIYHWSPNDLLKVAQKSFEDKEYKKAAQFYHTYLQLSESHQKVDDEILFQAGLSAYYSGEYYPVAEKYLSQLEEEFPNSSYFRGAKLWKSLSYIHQGKTKEFYQVVEEFRKKYQNTPEWSVLRGHYEEFSRKYRP